MSVSSTLKRPGLLLAVLVAASVVFELALIARYGRQGGLVRSPELDSPYLYTLVPGVPPANDQGILRAGPTSATPAPGVFRILSYGDSIGTGYGIDPSQMYAVRLEASFAASPTDGAAGPFEAVEILSMARGHSPTAYAFHLRVDVPRLAPHAVLVLVELSNDVSDEARVRTRGRDANGLPLELTSYRYSLSWDDQLLAPPSIGAGPIERTRTYYALSRWFGRLVRKLWQPPAFGEDSDTFYYSVTSDRHLLGDEALEAGFERTFDTLAAMKRYLDARGVRLLVAVLPARYAFEAEHRYQPGAGRLLRRAAQSLADRGVPAISLRDEMAAGGGAGLYQDFCHPTAAGNRAIAAALHPVIARWVE